MDPVTENEREETAGADLPGLRELIKRFPTLQGQIDRIVEDRLKRERAGFDKRLEEEIDQRTAQLRQEIETLSSPRRDEIAEAVAGVKAELGAERDRWAERARAWEERFKRGQAERLLWEAAVKRGAYKPRQVVDLLADRIAWEDGEGEPQPVLGLHDETGRKVVYRGAEIAKGVAAYLADNPNLVAAGAGTGAGGRPGVPGLPLTAEALRHLGVEDLRRLRPELERLAAELGH
ncbi:MAG TPA: hypothetical protein PK961_09985 [bacterium]|nr:hypothetical protein [bacterium]